jgi:hypothetical protein
MAPDLQSRSGAFALSTARRWPLFPVVSRSTGHAGGTCPSRWSGFGRCPARIGMPYSLTACAGAGTGLGRTGDLSLFKPSGVLPGGRFAWLGGPLTSAGDAGVRARWRHGWRQVTSSSRLPRAVAEVSSAGQPSVRELASPADQLTVRYHVAHRFFLCLSEASLTSSSDACIPASRWLRAP